MKGKTVYLYIAIFVVAVVVLVLVDFGDGEKETTTTIANREMPNDAIHRGAKMPNDAIHGGGKMPNDAMHGGISADDLPNKSNVKPEYYRTLDSLKTAYEKNPADTAVALKYAEYLLAGHGADKAVKIYDDLVKRYPNSASISASASYVYFETGQIDKAEALLEKAVKKMPGNLTAYYNLGLMKLMKKDTTGARKIWEDIAKNHSDADEAQYAKIALEKLVEK